MDITALVIGKEKSEFSINSNIIEMLNQLLRIYRKAKIFGWAAFLTSMALTINLLQLPTLLLMPLYRRQMMRLNAFLCGLLWKVMQRIFERQQAKITYSGDEIPPGESAIVIPNHISGSDFYLVHHLANRAGMLQWCNYFAKDSLKWIPGFGWGMWLMGLIYVKRNWADDAASIERAFSGIKSQERPSWIVMFLEGTRRTPEKLTLVPKS